MGVWCTVGVCPAPVSVFGVGYDGRLERSEMTFRTFETVQNRSRMTEVAMSVNY